MVGVGVEACYESLYAPETGLVGDAESLKMVEVVGPGIIARALANTFS